MLITKLHLKWIASFLFTNLITISAFSSNSIKGFYKVPLKPENKSLEPFSVYPVDYNANDFFSDPNTMNFALPAALVGERKAITINKTQGSANKWTGPNVESGTCNTVDRRITCTLKFKDLNINQEHVQNVINQTYLDQTEANNRIQVAEMFGSEPLGIISYKFKNHKDDDHQHDDLSDPQYK